MREKTKTLAGFMVAGVLVPIVVGFLFGLSGALCALIACGGLYLICSKSSEEWQTLSRPLVEGGLKTKVFLVIYMGIFGVTLFIVGWNQMLSSLPLPRLPAEKISTTTELALELAGSENLTLQLANTTSVTAQKPKFWFKISDTTNGFVWPEKPGDYEPLPLQTQTYSDEYVNGNSRLGPYSVLRFSPGELAQKHVRKGDVLVGSIGTTCFNCTRIRDYYIYFKVGTGGWFYSIPSERESHLRVPDANAKTISEIGLNQFLDKEIPVVNRISIPEKFDYTKPTRLLP